MLTPRKPARPTVEAIDEFCAQFDDLFRRCTIQIALGWSDEHLNRFVIHGGEYGVYHLGGISFRDGPRQVRPAAVAPWRRLGACQSGIDRTYRTECVIHSPAMATALVGSGKLWRANYRS